MVVPLTINPICTLYGEYFLGIPSISPFKGLPGGFQRLECHPKGTTPRAAALAAAALEANLEDESSTSSSSCWVALDLSNEKNGGYFL